MALDTEFEVRTFEPQKLLCTFNCKQDLPAAVLAKLQLSTVLFYDSFGQDCLFILFENLRYMLIFHDQG
jgi:hypothetical protein